MSELFTCTQPGRALHTVECPGCHVYVTIPHVCDKLDGVLRWADEC